MNKPKRRKLPQGYTRIRENVDTVPLVIRELESEKVAFGQRVAEKMARFVGSWQFIIIQTIILCFWIVANVVGWVHHWDPYPFILLNLFLSFQAAYCGPVIMMAQNRQEAHDRVRAELDLQVNLVAEREIKKLLLKFDASRIAHVAKIEHQLNEVMALLKKR